MYNKEAVKMKPETFLKEVYKLDKKDLKGITALGMDSRYIRDFIVKLNKDLETNISETLITFLSGITTLPSPVRIAYQELFLTIISHELRVTEATLKRAVNDLNGPCECDSCKGGGNA